MENRVQGVKYMLIASFLFAFMGVFVKELSETINSLEITFFRNVFGVVIIAISIYKTPLIQVGGKLWLLIFRGVMGFIALLAFFYNIAHIPLADAMTFSKTAPIFTALFAFIFLHEKLNYLQVFAVFVGFIGIVLIIQPNGFTFTKTDLLGIFSGVGAGLAYTSVRELRKYYDSRGIVLSFVLVGTISPAVLLTIGTLFETPQYLDFMLAPIVIPTFEDIPKIIALGVLATFAQIYMTKAYGETKAGIVGVVSYSNILFSLILGIFLIGDEVPNLATFGGIFLIVLSGYFVAKK